MIGYYLTTDCQRLIVQSWGKCSGTKPGPEHCERATVILNECARIGSIDESQCAEEVRHESIEGQALAKGLLRIIQTRSDRASSELAEVNELIADDGPEFTNTEGLNASVDWLQSTLAELSSLRDAVMEVNGYFDTAVGWDRLAVMLLNAFRDAAQRANPSRKPYGYSKDGPAVRFVQLALEEITFIHHELGKISSALGRARKRNLASPGLIDYRGDGGLSHTAGSDGTAFSDVSGSANGGQ